MIDIPRNDTHEWSEGSSWYPLNEPDCAHQQVIFTCPNGHRLVLFNKTQTAPRHGISADGTVDGSVVCVGRPNSPCTFHDHVRLLDWTGDTLARL